MAPPVKATNQRGRRASRGGERAVVGSSGTAADFRPGAVAQPPPLTSGAKVQPGSARWHRESLSRAAVPPCKAMRLWLLCSFAAAVALVAVAGADHSNSKKVARGREESRSMSWRDGEDDEGQPGRRGTPRRRAAQAMGPRAAAEQAKAQQLQELWSRTERAERRLLACENLVGELGSNLAALGSLLQEYGHLRQRLDNVENLLKNRNFWILRLPPGSRGEVPKVPVTFDDISVYFNEEEWERLDRWQKDLYRAVMRGNYETLISLDYAVSKPDILSRIERDEELCIRDGQEPLRTHVEEGQERPLSCTREGGEPPQPPEEMDAMEEVLGGEEVPMEVGTDYAVSKPDILSRIERDEELCVRDGQEPPRTHVEEGQEPPRTHVEEGQEPPRTHVEEGQEPPRTQVEDDQEPPQTHTKDNHERPWMHSEEGQEPLQMRIEEGQEPLQTHVIEGQEPRQTHIEEGQEPPQTHIEEGQEPPQTHIEEGQEPPQTHIEEGQEPPQTHIEEGQEPPQTHIEEGQEPPQTHIKEGQEPPQTHIEEGQEPPRTHIEDDQEPLQPPEELDKKEESLGEDKAPTEAGTAELPILVMNVMSLSAQKAELRREDQPEAEMEEDPAESSTEEGFLLGNEMECEGASPPENVMVKEEGPEASQEVSAPSPAPEIQNCPKSEQAKAKSKKKPSRCASSSLLMGNCRRGYVREWSHPCTECGKRFRLKINLIIHQRSHAKEGPYECTMCEISFADKRHLDLHQSIHIKDRAFGAKVWGNVHPELRIRPRGKFHGVFCGGAHSLGNGTYTGGPWLGQAKEELDRGQQSPKSRRKPVKKCGFCKKILSCTFSLQRHLQTHVEARPYCCTACKKRFTRKTHLSRHEKIHNRQKALATLQQPAAVVPVPQQPQPQGAAPEPPAGGSIPRSPAPERNVSPAAATGKVVPGDVLLVGPAELGRPDENCHLQGWGGRAVRPVVRLGNRAAVSGVMEK
ncbi:uncharacterized protein RDI95_007999 [Morus bassanus]